MNVSTKNLKLYSWIFSAIWSREPLIFHGLNDARLHEFVEEITTFIPRYRQGVVYGETPKSILNGDLRPRVLAGENQGILKETILTSFEEERNLESRPLQFIAFNVRISFFKEILKHLDRGWIATTTHALDELNLVFKYEPFEIHNFDNSCSVIFLAGHPKKVPIELELVKAFIARSDLAAKFLIEKKLSEIRYAAEALVREIERGYFFHQVEVQELFELDANNFEKCLQIIEVEFHLKVTRYIKKTATRIKRILSKVIALEGVIYACALTNGELTGLLKKHDSIPFPLVFFREIFSFITFFSKETEFGEMNQILVELSRKTKVVIFFDNDLKNGSKSLFGFFLNSETPVAPFNHSFSHILESEKDSIDITNLKSTCLISEFGELS